MLLIADAGATVAAAMPIASAVTPRGATSCWIFTLTPLLCPRCVQPERYLAASIEKATCRDRTLCNYRQKRKNPYLTLSTAKALHGLELKFGYLRREHELRRQRQNPEAS